jgi:hypothetical protein
MGNLRNNMRSRMPPKEKTIIPPTEGWTENTWYLAEVAYNPYNPIHRTLFYSGFLNSRTNGPGGYNCLIACNGGSESKNIYDAHYLKILKIVLTDEESQMPISYPEHNFVINDHGIEYPERGMTI